MMVYWSKRFIAAQGVVYCCEILISLQIHPVNIMKKEFYFPKIKHMCIPTYEFYHNQL